MCRGRAWSWSHPAGTTSLSQVRVQVSEPLKLDNAQRPAPSGHLEAAPRPNLCPAARVPMRRSLCACCLGPSSATKPQDVVARTARPVEHSFPEAFAAKPQMGQILCCLCSPFTMQSFKATRGREKILFFQTTLPSHKRGRVEIIRPPDPAGANLQAVQDMAVCIRKGNRRPSTLTRFI